MAEEEETHFRSVSLAYKLIYVDYWYNYKIIALYGRASLRLDQVSEMNEVKL